MKDNKKNSGNRIPRRVGVIGRFKPLHLGAAAMLEALCSQAEEVLIGIGSCNKYNLRNPFTARESEEMINAFLSGFSNYKICHIPDFAHIPKYRDGKKWKEYVVNKFGELDYFVTSNYYVKELLKDVYEIIHPANLIDRENQILLGASEVRFEVARYGNWRDLVPEKVADYLEENDLVERFRKEFGLQTLATLSGKNLRVSENQNEEKLHAQEV